MYQAWEVLSERRSYLTVPGEDELAAPLVDGVDHDSRRTICLPHQLRGALIFPFRVMVALVVDAPNLALYKAWVDTGATDTGAMQLD